MRRTLGALIINACTVKNPRVGGGRGWWASEQRLCRTRNAHFGPPLRPVELRQANFSDTAIKHDCIHSVGLLSSDLALGFLVAVCRTPVLQVLLLGPLCQNFIYKKMTPSGNLTKQVQETVPIRSASILNIINPHV